MDTMTLQLKVCQCFKCFGDTEYFCESCQCDLCRQYKENHGYDLKTIDNYVVLYNIPTKEVYEKFHDMDNKELCIFQGTQKSHYL